VVGAGKGVDERGPVQAGLAGFSGASQPPSWRLLALNMMSTHFVITCHHACPTGCSLPLLATSFPLLLLQLGADLDLPSPGGHTAALPLPDNLKSPPPFLPLPAAPLAAAGG